MAKIGLKTTTDFSIKADKAEVSLRIIGTNRKQILMAYGHVLHKFFVILKAVLENSGQLL